MTADPGVGSLYLHIPFCERKCEYCDFVSVAGAHGQHEYVAALRAEVRALSPALDGRSLRTIFVGGGTPGLLDLGPDGGVDGGGARYLRHRSDR